INMNRQNIPYNAAKETHDDGFKNQKIEKKYNTHSETSTQAFAKAKHVNGIPNSQEPYETQTRIPDRNNQGMFCTQYEFRNDYGTHISIRSDNPTEYENSAGNQKGHYNAGVKDGTLGQHHSYDRRN
ncbi:unnamed protein product, partial [Didymodactylos carnosus]